MTNLNIDEPLNLRTPQDVAQWVLDQLRNIETALNSALPMIQLQELNVEPEKTFTGMTVLADGTNWDPGSGQGVYTYYNSTWNKLG